MSHELPEEVKRYLKRNAAAIRCETGKAVREKFIPLYGMCYTDRTGELVARAEKNLVAYDAAISLALRYLAYKKPMPDALNNFSMAVLRGDAKRPWKPGPQPDAVIGRRQVMFRAINRCRKAGIGIQPACKLITDFLYDAGIEINVDRETLRYDYLQDERKLKKLLGETLWREWRKHCYCWAGLAQVLKHPIQPPSIVDPCPRNDLNPCPRNTLIKYKIVK